MNQGVVGTVPAVSEQFFTGPIPHSFLFVFVILTDIILYVRNTFFSLQLPRVYLRNCRSEESRFGEMSDSR